MTEQSEARGGLVAAGAALVVVSVLFFGAALVRSGGLGPALGSWLAGGIGWGSAIDLLLSLQLFQARPEVPAVSELWRWLVPGFLFLAAGLLVVGSGLRTAGPVARPLSAAAGAPLYAPLRSARDLYWGTLGAYGGGILLAELGVVIAQTLLVAGTAGRLSLPPATAFGAALAVGGFIAFAAGFLGAARAGRLSGPEATLGFLYFGLPLPLFLTALTQNPSLSLPWAVRFREAIYLSSLLGQRPELGYWLVFGTLVVLMGLGMTTGFVATGSGRLDLKLGFELFVARRHVHIFRPSLLLGALAVLLFGILPPLLVFFMLRSAEEAAERTRIREMGLIDPLRASEALHAWKLRAQTPTAMMTALSVGGVGVGVMALIIVLSVMSGFEADLKQKILGTNAHAVVLKYATNSFTEFPEVAAKVHQVRGVTGTTPFILNEVMISSEGNISGTMLKGIDPSTVGEVSDLPRNVEAGGDLDWLSHPERIVQRQLRGTEPKDPLIDLTGPPSAGSPGGPVLPGIILGRELAHSLRAGVGDRVNVVSPLGGELGPQGPMPKSRPFRVAGLFYSGMYEYDSKFVYIALSEAQSFFGVKGVTGIELKVADVDDARRISQDVLETLGGYPYRTKDWGEMNRNLFSALRLEKLVMGIILTIIVIVAAGLIVATVIMLVLEKRKEISVLKALGVPDAGIVKIFLAEGLQIGVAGGLLGLFSGLAWCLFIEKVGIKLDPEVYYIPSLPVRIEPLQTALAVIVAILITYLASIYPALKASQVEPVEGLKAE